MLKILYVISMLLISTPALAEFKDYTAGKFKESLNNGNSVVLDFHASWCPTCRAQAKAFEQLSKEEKLKNIDIFKVDYDNSDDLQKEYKVKNQSTIILFKDKKETKRVSGVTDVNKLRTFLSE